MALASHSINGNTGPAATTGTVTRAGTDNSLPVTVALTSSNPAAVAVPAAVVIPAGQASATFNVDAPVGGAAPGTQTVKVGATATAEAALTYDNSFSSSTQLFTTNALAVQADGKVVAAGTYTTGSSNNYYRTAVVRYNADGSLDRTFNYGGMMTAGVAGQSWQAQAVAVRPTDGEVFVGGVFNVTNDNHLNFAVARYSATGTFDGMQTLTPTSGLVNEIWAMAVQPDGKVLLGGDIDNGTATSGDLAVIRLNADGSVDSTFGNGTVPSVSFSYGTDRGYGLALQPDGKVIVSGTSFDGYIGSQFAVARFTTTGQLDPTFGAGGKVQTDIPGGYDQARAIALQPDGKFILAGSVSRPGASSIYNDFALARYTANGALDPTFGTNGIAIQDFGGNDQANAVGVEPDGTIIVGGSGQAAGGPLVARFLPNGSLDASLGLSGYPIQALVIQPSGRVVAARGTSIFANSGSILAFTGATALVGSDSLTVVSLPSATNDSYTVAKSTPLVVAAPGILGNDFDPNGLPLSPVLVAGPAHGTLALNADGSFTYTPRGAYLGSDSFTYKASDGTYSSGTATVSLVVAGDDDAPVSADESYTVVNQVDSSGVLYLSSPGVLANDTDANGQALTAVLVAGPTHGTLALYADGAFLYQPTPDYFGTDSFTYRASDGQLLGNIATVSMTMKGFPEVVGENYTASENTPLVVAAPGVTGNDISPYNLPLAASLDSAPAHGKIVLNADGSFSYTPALNYWGNDSFMYHVTDGRSVSGSTTDYISVAHVNQAPIAADDSYTVNEDSTLTTFPVATSIQMTSQAGDYVGQGKTYNFTPANATITASVANNVVHFYVTSSTDTFDYYFAAPNGAKLVPGGYAGAMRWPFEDPNAPGLDVSGDGRGSNTLTGQFTVYQALYDNNGNIIAFAADFRQLGQGSTGSLTGLVQFHSSLTALGGVTLNDADADNDALTARLVAGPSHGSLGLNADGSFRYVPRPGYSGTDQFSYVANDGQLDSNVATVSIAVNQARLVDDPGFENVPQGTGPSAYIYNPTGSAWTFAGSAGLAGNGSAFTAGNPNAPDGTQVAFLQGTGSITQALYNVAAGTYQVNVAAAQRQNLASNQAVSVLVDGVVIGTIRPTGTTYATYASPSFTVAAGSHTIALQGTSTANDYTAFVDTVVLAPAVLSGTPTPGDAGFEAVAVGTGPSAYIYDPTGSAWTFAGSAGVAGNGSAFTAGNPSAPQGSQVAFLQQTGSISQTIAGWAAGTYNLSLLAAQRGNVASSQTLQVLIDGVVVDTIRPGGTAYTASTTASFSVGAGSHTVTIRGTSTGADYTAFIDGIQVNAAPAPAVPTPGDAGFENVPEGSGPSAYTYNPTGSAWTFAGSAGVAGNGSAFTAGNPSAPQGSQVAFLQQTGSISQTIAGWAAGTYNLSLLAAQRGNVASSQTLQVLIDGAVVGTITPSGTAYTASTTASFTVGAGSHTVTIRGTSTTADYTAFIDDVAIAAASSSTSGS